MANQASIQKHIDKGYGKVAQHLGGVYQWYRPTPNNPISPANSHGTIMAHFDTKYTFTGVTPSLDNPIVGIALNRGLGIQVWDYLIGSMGTYFIYSFDDILPSVAVYCNSIVSVYRPGGGQAVGNQYYGGNAQGYGNPILTNMPFSILNGTKGESSKSGVMADTRLQWFAILAPYVGVLIKANDLIIDEHNRRMTISAVELTDLGYCMTAAYSGT